MITIAYTTSRLDPKFEWFADSLHDQCKGDYTDIALVIVDFNATTPDRHAYFQSRAHCPVTVVPPKPNVWQGPYKLPKSDWWAAANCRNTALCLARDGTIAYIDDLSVLCPGWLDRVRLAAAGNYVALGVYEKVNKLVVERGQIVSYEPFSKDSRLDYVTQDLTHCHGGWLFGCSLAGSVEHFLKVGGWPEYADGLKFEDCLMGCCMHNAGIVLQLDRLMGTKESEEHHHGGKVFVARDKGVSPNDKSHAALHIAQASTYFPNYYEGGIRAMRDHVLAGNPFPIVQIPQHDWFDSQPLREFE
jgi:hypothetical protein